jgi:hypothetical protein
MKSYLGSTICILLLLFSACNRQKEAASLPTNEKNSTVLNQHWATDALWDDGLAEVARYEAERIVYGQTRHFEYTHILVKEDFNKEYNVKTDDYSRRDLFPVMKVNQFARIPTEKYPYHYLSSLFYKREKPGQLHKMTSSSQEWCGNTFKAFDHKGKNYRYLYSSYWDGQGNDHMKLKGNIWFEDGLSYTLRALNFRQGLSFEKPVLESQVSNKASKPAIYQAYFQVEDDTTLTQKAWLVKVQLDKENISRYWFARDYPNILLKQESHDGRKLRLTEASREAYWE